MKTSITAASMLIRITGLIQIVSGVIFWTGNALNLTTFHIVIGIILVLSLWFLAILAAQSGMPMGLPALALVWGAALAIVGYTQQNILPGPSHVWIQIIHLLLGVGAVGLGEALAGRLKRLGLHIMEA